MNGFRDARGGDSVKARNELEAVFRRMIPTGSESEGGTLTLRRMDFLKVANGRLEYFMYSGNIIFKGNVVIEEGLGRVKFMQTVRASGSISSGEGTSILATHGIGAGCAIRSGSDLETGGIITAGSDIEVRGSASAGGIMIALGSIVAVGGIRANGFVGAVKGIKAGQSVSSMKGIVSIRADIESEGDIRTGFGSVAAGGDIRARSSIEAKGDIEADRDIEVGAYIFTRGNVMTFHGNIVCMRGISCAGVAAGIEEETERTISTAELIRGEVLRGRLVRT